MKFDTVFLALACAANLGRGPAAPRSIGAAAAGITGTLEFAFQAPAGEPWKLTGCLLAVSGHYMITDEITNVTVEVAGPGLELESGNRVEVTGSLDPAKPPISGASHYIRVSRVKRLSKNCAPKDKAPKAGAASDAGGALGGSVWVDRAWSEVL